MVAVAGSFVCCSVVILFVCVVLLCVLFESFKVIVCHSVVVQEITRLLGVIVLL